MTDFITHQAGQAVRASDGERDHVVALLQRHFADGRLTAGRMANGAPRSARELADCAGLPADRLYYHLGQLEQAD